MRLTHFCYCCSHDAGIMFQFMWNLFAICIWFTVVLTLSLVINSFRAKVILNLLNIREMVRFT